MCDLCEATEQLEQLKRNTYGVLGAKPQSLGDFCNFSAKIFIKGHLNHILHVFRAIRRTNLLSFCHFTVKSEQEMDLASVIAMNFICYQLEQGSGSP